MGANISSSTEPPPPPPTTTGFPSYPSNPRIRKTITTSVVDDNPTATTTAPTKWKNTNQFHQTSPPPSASAVVVSPRSLHQWRSLFTAAKNSNNLMVVDFTASWCRPCRIMEEFVKNNLISRFTDVMFVQVDVDELMGVASEFGVEALPTFVLFKKGVVVDKVVGVHKEELKHKVEIHQKI